MNTIKFKRNYYIIEVYYKDNYGKTIRHTTQIYHKGIARQIDKMYKDRIGTMYEGCEFEGEIIGVYTFEAKQYRFED